jgi:hypothetical protein
MAPLYRESWPGKNNFCCFGRCITGPRGEHGGWCFFWGPVIVVGIPFLAIGGWRLGPINPAAIVVPALFYFMTCLCQSLTSCTDPGSAFIVRLQQSRSCASGAWGGREAQRVAVSRETPF